MRGTWGWICEAGKPVIISVFLFRLCLSSQFCSSQCRCRDTSLTRKKRIVQNIQELSVDDNDVNVEAIQNNFSASKKGRKSMGALTQQALYAPLKIIILVVSDILLWQVSHKTKLSIFGCHSPYLPPIACRGLAKLKSTLGPHWLCCSSCDSYCGLGVDLHVHYLCIFCTQR